MASCRAMRATLLAAKLDRLSRNVAFLSGIMESKVDFLCCDNPHATSFTLHILAAVAEHESGMISARTKAALAAAKARGKRFGNPNLRPGSAVGTVVAREAHIRQARQRAMTIMPTAARRAGAASLREVAEAMVARGVATPSGRGRRHPATVLQTKRIANRPAATALLAQAA